ncbi:MAG: hypothetical protein JKY65_00355 [Planctomycetes bacterium]|nr:hypothetical protein [Planctomycetota bacterium]
MSALTLDAFDRRLHYWSLLCGLCVLLLGCSKAEPHYRPSPSASAASTSATSTAPQVQLPGSTAPLGSGSTPGLPSGPGAPTAPPVASAPVAQAGPGGLSLPPTRSFPAPGAPITIGAGPVIGRTARGDVFQHLREWTQGDLRALDRLDVRLAGDGLTASRELVAFYTRRDADRLSLRIDLLDLRYGAELGGLDLVILIGWGAGGSVTLPLGIRERSTPGYQAAIVVEDTRQFALLNGAGTAQVTTQTQSPAGGAALEVSFRSDLDAIEIGLDLAPLRALGWSGQDLWFQVASARDGRGRVEDAILEVDVRDGSLDEVIRETWVADRRAAYAPIAVGNRAALSSSYLRGLVFSDQITTREGFPTGLRRTLETHRVHGQPISIHLSGVLTESIGWASSADPRQDGAAFLAEVATFFDGDATNGEGDFLPGLYVDNIMPYFEGAPNQRFMAQAQKVYDQRLGLSQPGKVFWIPERVARGRTLEEISQAGFTHSVLDRTHLQTWFSEANIGGGLHRINGVDCFVIDPSASPFRTEDGGPSLALRRLLLERALDPNPEQVVIYVADWEEFAGRKGSADVPDHYDRVIQWLAQRPWIEIAGLEDLAARGWSPVKDHGAQPALPIETHTWLRHATEADYDNWYYGHPLEESLASLQPPIRQGRPSVRRLGDVRTPGTLFGDTWSAIQQAPAGGLRELAEAAFSSKLYRTAWHGEDMHDTQRFVGPNGLPGAYVSPDLTPDRLSGFSRALQTRVGEAAVIARAARWAASPPSQAHTAREDVDLDGEEELLLLGPQLMLVIERDGGRLVASFVREANGAGYQITGDPIAFPSRSVETGFEDEGHDAARNSCFKDVFLTGTQRNYTNDSGVAYVSTTSVAIVFETSDGALKKTYSWAGPGQVDVRYELAPGSGTLYLRCGLNPDLLGLVQDGQRGLSELDQGGVYTLSETRQGKTVSVALDYGSGGARLNGAASQGVPASPRDAAFQQMIELAGDAPGFTIRLGAAVR